jgi:tRNA 2-thiouridine synthesizing protein B
MTLHIVSRSPWSASAFAQCLRVLRPGDALLLTGDGVNAALAGTEPLRALQKLASVPVHVLAEDCALRGLHALPDGVQGIDYTQFVALACTHERCMSWF